MGLEKMGRELGTQTWALHPVVRGSIPLRSIYFITISDFQEDCNEYFKERKTRDGD
jgi:hypothetical protein